MKSLKVIVSLVALCAINVVEAATMLQGANYQRFSNHSQQYRDRIITADGTFDMSWVQQGVDALRQDGLYNSQQFAQLLWGDVEAIINYYAQLPQFRKYADFKNRLWSDLTRKINNIVQQPVQQQQPQVYNASPSQPFSSLDRFLAEQKQTAAPTRVLPPTPVPARPSTSTPTRSLAPARPSTPVPTTR